MRGGVEGGWWWGGVEMWWWVVVVGLVVESEDGCFVVVVKWWRRGGLRWWWRVVLGWRLGRLMEGTVVDMASMVVLGDKVRGFGCYFFFFELSTSLKKASEKLEIHIQGGTISVKGNNKD